MPIAYTEAMLAAHPGSDAKRRRARRAVLLAYFTQHIFEQDVVQDWNLVMRALQCVDWAQPVTFGPMPPAPPRLVAVASGSLGLGFFAVEPHPLDAKSDQPAQWWTVEPHTEYVRFCAPTVVTEQVSAKSVPLYRYFVPGARLAKGPRGAQPLGPALK